VTKSLPQELNAAVDAAFQDWTAGDKTAKLWNKDTSLWTGADEDHWLGWLDIAEKQLAEADRFEALAAEVKSAGYTDAVLLGMGGSSVGPEVLFTLLDEMNFSEGASLGHFPGSHVFGCEKELLGIHEQDAVPLGSLQHLFAFFDGHR